MKANRTILNEAQLRLLDLVAVVNTTEELEGLRRAIIDYLATQLQNELDNLWADGTLNEEKVEQFRHLHERTTYRKATMPCSKNA